MFHSKGPLLKPFLQHSLPGRDAALYHLVCIVEHTWLISIAADYHCSDTGEPH